jgi:hypothetical protein
VAARGARLTRWLEENSDAVSDVLDFTLSNVERERAAGSFSVDLLGEDDEGRPVVIENQLERSDHDHLGKLITYLAAFDAVRAVWIVAHPRPEHVGAITWLNESSAGSFYLLKVEAVRIHTSPPAPLLTLIVGPSPEARQVGVAKQERAERHDHRQAFWASLLERARPRTRLHSAVSAGTDSWLGTSAGRSGVGLYYSIKQHGAGVYLWIERPSAEENVAIFRQLEQDRAEVEAAVGHPLEWSHVEGRKRCAIGVTFDGRGYGDAEETWAPVQDRMIDTMIRLDAALRPRLNNVAIP